MRRWIVALVAAACFLMGGTADAAPPEIDDLLLTIKVRALLYKDAELRSYNIGVLVVDRVAILFGPVPKIDLGLRAESLLRDLIELRDVRNEIDIISPLPEFLPDRIPSPAPRLEQRRRQPAPGVVPVELRSPRVDLTMLTR